MINGLIILVFSIISSILLAFGKWSFFQYFVVFLLIMIFKTMDDFYREFEDRQ